MDVEEVEPKDVQQFISSMQTTSMNITEATKEA